MKTLDSPAAIARSFEEDGYYLARGVYSPEEVARLEAAFDRIVAQLLASGEPTNARWGGAEVAKLGASDTVVLHTHNVQQYSAEWLRAFLHPGYLHYARAILGESVVLHHSKLFQKPAENGAPFPMHQDWGYFPSARDSMMAGDHPREPGDRRDGLPAGVPGLAPSRAYGGEHGAERQPPRRVPHRGRDAAGGRARGCGVLLVPHGPRLDAEPERPARARRCSPSSSRARTGSRTGWSHPNERLVLSGWNASMKRSDASLKM